MIYVTGDCHGDFRRFNTQNFPEQKEMSKDDYVIICGDFGGVWNKDGENKQEKHEFKWLQEKPFTVLFVDGNHENFNRLYAYPVEQWHGGKVHKIRDSILHLMRGQIYEINRKTFFTFGGASSHDIDGGILDPEEPNFRQKKKFLDREYISYRIKNITWWERELPTKEEMEEGRRNLEKHGNAVDFIVTHCCATDVQEKISARHKRDVLTDYLEEIRKKVAYQKWFFGHYHDNLNVSGKDVLVYEQIVRIK